MESTKQVIFKLDRIAKPYGLSKMAMGTIDGNHIFKVSPSIYCQPSIHRIPNGSWSHGESKIVRKLIIGVVRISFGKIRHWNKQSKEKPWAQGERQKSSKTKTVILLRFFPETQSGSSQVCTYSTVPWRSRKRKSLSNTFFRSSVRSWRFSLRKKLYARGIFVVSESWTFRIDSASWLDCDGG